MKLLVCGSRSWADRDYIADVLSAYADQPGVLVFHGAAEGADTLAGDVARLFGFQVREFPADWRTHGRRAGLVRNLAMLDQRPDRVIAFQLGGSRGTQHTIDNAHQRRIPVEVHTPCTACAGHLISTVADGERVWLDPEPLQVPLVGHVVHNPKTGGGRRILNRADLAKVGVWMGKGATVHVDHATTCEPQPRLQGFDQAYAA